MTPKELIAEVGGPTVLAKALGLRHSTPILWHKIPPHHYAKIESTFGISRERLVANLFERPAPASERPAQEAV